MSIIDAFDNTSKPLVDIGAFYGEKKRFADVCVVSFSRHVLNMFLEKYKGQSIGHSGTCNGHIEIYLFEVEGKKLLFYMSPIGSAVAATVLYEVHHVSGATKFVVYGSCGVLDKEKCHGKLIVPSHAYRDEGLSYHYMPPSNYVEVANCGKIAEIFEKNDYPYVVGKTWTTDAIYMETQNKVKRHKDDGCISVEMECAGLQALCNYYGFELYTFFYGGDLFDGDLWERSNLGGNGEHNISKATFDIALKVALNI